VTNKTNSAPGSSSRASCIDIHKAKNDGIASRHGLHSEEVGTMKAHTTFLIGMTAAPSFVARTLGNRILRPQAWEPPSRRLPGNPLRGRVITQAHIQKDVDVYSTLDLLKYSTRILNSGGTFICIVPLKGKLCIDTVTVIQRYIKKFVINDDVSGYIFDIGNISYIDSYGIAMFIEIVKWCKCKNSHYRFANPSPKTRAIIALTHWDKILHVCDSVDQAIVEMKAVLSMPDSRQPHLP
jgi:anti-anti-sigma factor